MQLRKLYLRRRLFLLDILQRVFYVGYFILFFFVDIILHSVQLRPFKFPIGA